MSGEDGLTPKQALVYRALVRAADAGEPCPSNPQLGEMTGAKSVSFGAAAVSAIEAAGLIVVQRFGHSREVTIVSTGTRTAQTTGKRIPHWSARGIVRQARERQEPSANRDRPDDRHLPPAVDRDPCPRCGTRRDHGCAHGPTRLGLGLSL